MPAGAISNPSYYDNFRKISLPPLLSSVDRREHQMEHLSCGRRCEVRAAPRVKGSSIFVTKQIYLHLAHQRDKK